MTGIIQLFLGFCFITLVKDNLIKTVLVPQDVISHCDVLKHKQKDAPQITTIFSNNIICCPKCDTFSAFYKAIFSTSIKT